MKKAITLFMLLALAVVFTACGANTQEQTVPSAETDRSETETAEEDTENDGKTLKAAKNAGMDLGDYSKYASTIKSMESDRYPDTGKACRHSKPDRGIYTKQDKVIQYIDSLDISNKQKRALWDVEGYSPKNMPGSWWD